MSSDALKGISRWKDGGVLKKIRAKINGLMLKINTLQSRSLISAFCLSKKG
jgi:hypothetical protein